MVESEIESDSTKKNEYYQKKIERITDDYENQNRQKNQELDEIFEEITLENDNLRKELLLTKEELEGEIEKNIDIKNSIYNFNYFTKKTSKELDEKLGKDKNIKEDYTNSIFCDYLKTIKEESNKKLSELNIAQENNLKSFELMRKSLENKINNIYNMLKEDERMNIYLKDIIKELNIYNNKHNSLLSENYSDKKYIIILLEKLGLAREEILFLKERIIKEKKIILEKIYSLSYDNELTHISMIQEILNEINQKRKNYFNEQFLFPIQDLHKSFLEFKEKEKELVNKNEILKKELEELKYKFNKVNEEKEEMMKNAVNYTINKENNKNNEAYLQSMVNKLRKEKSILENENNSLLKNNSELNEQIISINNKIKLELNKKNSDKLSLLNQKDSLIRELNKKLNTITEATSRDKTTINDLGEEIESLNNKIKELTNNENNLKSEILLLKKALKESNYKVTTMAQTNTMDSYNNTRKNQNVLTDKKSTKNNIDNNYRNKNSELNTSNKDKFKLTSTEKSNEGENNLAQIIRKIYLNHISNEIDNNDEIYMLNEINNKLTQMETTSSNNNTLGNNQFIKMKIVYNEDFEGLEQNKNSQLYENLLIYIFHLKSQQQIEINKIISNYIPPSDNKNTKMLEILDKLKIELDEECEKFEERIKHSVNIDEVEQLLIQLKNFYEVIIDYIIKNFYNYKRDLSGNILTIQLPLDEYHKIINNTATNLTNIDSNIINKINEYKGQGNKMENAINILIDTVNNNLNG